MTGPNFATRVAQSSIGQKLRAWETFTPADTASGNFTLSTPRDDARFQRTGGWLPAGCEGMWRWTTDQPNGLIHYHFELVSDAIAFRAATAADPGMIRCI